jgi:hypothetical protein
MEPNRWVAHRSYDLAMQVKSDQMKHCLSKINADGV